MLSRREAQLLFPRIKFLRRDKLVWKSRKGDRPSRPREVTLYTLDWDRYEQERKEAFEQRGANGWYVRGWSLYAQALPPEYEKMIRELVYAISPEYMGEIQRNAERAVEEWGVERGFDTIVREECLSPAIEHVRVAFYLLEDCLFDPAARYWMDQDSLAKKVSLQATLFKLWAGQTGDALVPEFARMKDLQGSWEGYRTDDVITFVESVTQWHESRHGRVAAKGRRRTRGNGKAAESMESESEE